MAAFVILHGVGNNEQPFLKMEIPGGIGYQNTPLNGNSKGVGDHNIKTLHKGVWIFFGTTQ